MTVPQGGTIETESPRAGTGPQCYVTALHQPDVGVLSLRCTLRQQLPEGGAELVFVRHDGKHVTHPVRVDCRGGTAVFEARIRLIEADQLLLEPGLWDLRLSLDTERTQLPLLPPSFGREQWPTITLPATAGPYKVSLSSQHGAMTLQVTRSTRYLEIDKIDFEGTTLTIAGHCVPSVSHDAAGQIVIRSRRRGDAAVRLPVSFVCTQVHASIDLALLASEEHETWDFYLWLDGGPELRLGSHLDDVRNKIKAVCFPTCSVPRAGQSTLLQPFYTVDNNLSVQVEPTESEVDRDGPSHAPSSPAIKRPSLGGPAWHLTSWLLAVMEAMGRLRRPHPYTDNRKIYFLVHDAFGVGGIARTVLGLAKHLAQDHDVEIISLVRSRRRPTYEIDPRIRLVPLLDEIALEESRQSGLKQWLRRVLGARTSWMLHPKDPIFDRHSLWLDLKLLQSLHSLQPGVLISTLPGLNVIAARFARPGIITVGQEHQSSTRRGSLLGPMRTHYPKLDALTVLTAADEEYYRTLLAGAATRVACIPNALPEPPTARTDLDSKRIIAAGRYAPQKGFDLLISAFEIVARKYPDWSLRLYGGGPLYSKLQQQVRRLGLYDNVFLMGRTDQLTQELAQSSIFVLSSRWEGFGLVIIEAMAVGLPVVSFDCPYGPRSIISDGVDGTLVYPKDVEALAAAITELIEDPEKRRVYSEAAQRTAESYDIDSIGQAWGRMFDALLDTARAEAEQTREG